MRNLLNFLLKYSNWFVFLFYVVLSCILLSNGSPYRQSVLFTSANSVSSAISGTVAEVTGYFGLRKANTDLQAANSRLSAEVLNLRNKVAQLQNLVPDSAAIRMAADRYSFETATVLNNTTSHPRNYFTINKGTDDGILPGMGVIDHNGIVGIVNVAGRHTARIISLLNVSQHFSVKIKGTEFLGSLGWQKGNPKIAYMEEVPRHAHFKLGDTIVTSGFSTTFPSGLPVGRVMGRVRGSDENYFTLKVELLPDFGRLNKVQVIKDSYKAELDTLSTYDINDGI